MFMENSVLNSDLEKGDWSNVPKRYLDVPELKCWFNHMIYRNDFLFLPCLFCREDLR